MKALIQRVRRADVSVGKNCVGKIDNGLLILLGVAPDDTEGDSAFLAQKIVNLRIFDDEKGKMNLSLKQSDGSVLVVSQFTLFADTSKGNRPSFTGAALPEKAESLYNLFLQKIKEQGIVVESGCFGAHMEIALVNDGPVTLMLESVKR
ncbi:MAG TPA: D-tyrosyl-tRNA(Tyr) deacylase [Firmicutes bacterium]|nr:D-tyrosyl-tRNA(Tyr) deacylase [Bacillota bacterium]